MISITVPGLPQALKRHRTFRRGNASYDPSKADKETILALVYNQRPAKPLTGTLEMTIIFSMPRPKSHYKKNGDLKPDAPDFHTNKPGLDNMVKFVKGALNKVFYIDDSQISRLVAVKYYTNQSPETFIKIEELVE